MKTNNDMYEKVVNERVAWLLYFAGFDQKCRHFYGALKTNPDARVLQIYGAPNRDGIMVPAHVRNSRLTDGRVAAPTFQIALKWLRKKFHVYILMRPVVVADRIGFAPEVYRSVMCENGTKVTLKHYSQCLKIYDNFEGALEDVIDWVVSDLLGFEDKMQGEPSEHEYPEWDLPFTEAAKDGCGTDTEAAKDGCGTDTEAAKDGRDGNEEE